MRVSRNEFLGLAVVTFVALTYARHACAEVLFVPTDRKAAAMETVLLPPVRPIIIDPLPPTWRPPRPSDLPFRVTNSRVDVRI